MTHLTKMMILVFSAGLVGCTTDTNQDYYSDGGDNSAYQSDMSGYNRAYQQQNYHSDQTHASTNQHNGYHSDQTHVPVVNHNSSYRSDQTHAQLNNNGYHSNQTHAHLSDNTAYQSNQTHAQLNNTGYNSNNKQAHAYKGKENTNACHAHGENK